MGITFRSYETPDGNLMNEFKFERLYEDGDKNKLIPPNPRIPCTKSSVELEKMFYGVAEDNIDRRRLVYAAYRITYAAESVQEDVKREQHMAQCVINGMKDCIERGSTISYGAATGTTVGSAYALSHLIGFTKFMQESIGIKVYNLMYNGELYPENTQEKVKTNDR